MSEEAQEALRPAAEEIAEQVGELSRRLFDYVDSRITGLGLTVPQALLLRELSSPLAMNKVAGRLHCDASNVTGIVDRLEGRGLVERRVRPDDRRVKELVLTPEGWKMKRQLEEVLTSTPGIGGLTSEDQTALRSLLARVLAEFDE